VTGVQTCALPICQVIETALAENGGRIVATAKALGVSRVTLWSKMKRFGIAKS
jgi:transcriptional regulator of acetoin/glycerol metabolism